MSAARTRRQALRFHEALQEGNGESRTVDCRHTKWDTRAKRWPFAVCASSQTDGMCLALPARWAKQSRSLSEKGTAP